MELTPEASDAMKKFYIDMRTRYTGEDIPTVSITLRQYEALIRMAEASAKIRLDTKIRLDDAERAIRLMRYSLSQLGYDYETGRIDIDRIESGVTASRRRKISVLLEIIDSLQKESKEVSIEDVKAEAESQGIEDAEEILERLKREGTIFEPKPGFIRRV
jgi:replicative DNA helicase Mcm